MIHHTRNPRGGYRLSQANTSLLKNPLDFIYQENLREREISAQLNVLAMSDTPDAEVAAVVLDYLRIELPLHLEDEEEDLFPLLLRRCEPEDEIGKAVHRLTADHRHADEDMPRLTADLTLLGSSGGKLSEDMRTRMASYASHARRHLIFENAIILPFARLRLTKLDLETLRLRMTQRRGLDP